MGKDFSWLRKGRAHCPREANKDYMPRARLVALGSGLSCTVLTAEKRLRGWLCLLSGRGQEHVCKVRP